MLYTLTINPAVDVYMNFDKVEFNTLNRTQHQEIKVGGKGINVSLALKSLGIDSIPIVVTGGFTGNYIETELKKEFHPVLFHVDEMTRINVKIKSNLEETEFNGTNLLNAKAIDCLHKYLMGLKKADFLIVSGNALLSTYEAILADLKCHIILDVDGKLLKQLLYLKPWLVKPNHLELYDVSPKIEEAYAILGHFAKFILHTKGKEGITLLAGEEQYSVEGIKTEAKTTIGCGDASLAGFIASYIQGKSLLECVKKANLCGYFRAKNGEFLIEK